MKTEPTPAPKLPSFLDLADGKNVAPMTEESTKLFLHLSVAEGANKALCVPFDLTLETLKKDSKYKGLAEVFIFQVMTKRLLVCAPATQVTLGVLIYLGSISPTPGQAVQWAYTLHRLSQKVGLVTMAALADAFPVGFPTAKTVENMWAAQKGIRIGVECDNYIDQQKAWVKV